MKKSSIFLGATAFVLAIAGAFATKAKSFTGTYFYKNTVGQYFQIPNPLCSGSAITCTYLTTGGHNHYKVFVTASGVYSTVLKAS